MNTRSQYFIYPRDKNGNLLGITICVLSHDNKVFHGQALCSKEDTFNKKVGREIALARANKALEKFKLKTGSRYDRTIAASESLLAKMVNMFRGSN